MKRFLFISLGSFFFLILNPLVLDFSITGYAESEAASKEIELKWVSFRPPTHKGVIAIRNNFIDPINNAAKGELKITWKGGPDTMAPRDIGLAVQRGTIDIGSIYVGAYEALVRGVGGAMLTQPARAIQVAAARLAVLQQAPKEEKPAASHA